MLLLTKLTLSHNALHEFPDLTSCPALKELRLNSNMIANIPSGLESRIPLLEILDLGNNPIIREGEILKLLPLRRLKNLSTKGCPFEEKSADASKRSKILSKLSRLEVFNGRLLDPKKAKRNQRNANTHAGPKRTKME